jgi:hypothetical protein
MMRRKDIARANAFFQSWVGATAVFNRYTTTHDRFVLELVRPGSPADFVGVSFTFTEYLAGKTRWSDACLACSLWETDDGRVGFEVKDDKGGFVLRCSGAIVVGDGEQTFPAD